jgi:ligand-binding sensor domain-containing protein
MVLPSRYKFILLIVAMLVTLYQCETDPGQVYPYPYESWETHDVSTGLSSNYIFSLKVDSKGNLWVGTLDDGIMKYDGDSWTYLDMEDGIHSNTIFSIEEDNNGHIWFGTLVGISIYDGSEFTNLYYEGEAESIHDILRDRANNMWLATGSKGLLKLENFDKITSYSSSSIPGSDSVNCIEEDGTGIIWAGTEGGVTKISGSGADYLQENDGIPAYPISSILSDQWGNVWFGSMGGENVTRLKSGSFQDISLQNTKNVNLVFDMVEGANSDIWFGLGVSGVVRYNGSQMKTYRDVEGLAGNTILCMELDQSGYIWLGTYGNGISLYKPQPRDLIPSVN